MRSSAVEGQHAPRVKQTPPPGNSGATAVPAGATPPSPLSSISSPRPQSSATAAAPLLSVKSSPQLAHHQRGSSATSPHQNSRTSSSVQRSSSGHGQLNRSKSTNSGVAPIPTTNAQQKSSNSGGTGGGGGSSIASVSSGGSPASAKAPPPNTSKGSQSRFTQPQAQKSSTGSGSSSQPPSKPTFAAVPKGVLHPSTTKQVSSPKSSSPQTANPPPPNFSEYDDQEWDVGVGHLIIDLDADIAQADRGRMSSGGASSSSSSNSSITQQQQQSTEDKHSLKMKIKRTKPPTKTSEAKHEIVKNDVPPVGTSSCPSPAVSSAPPQQNGGVQATKEENGTPLRINSAPVTTGNNNNNNNNRPLYKEKKRRLDMNGIAGGPSPHGATPVHGPRPPPHNPSSPASVTVIPQSAAAATTPSSSSPLPSMLPKSGVSFVPVTNPHPGGGSSKMDFPPALTIAPSSGAGASKPFLATKNGAQHNNATTSSQTSDQAAASSSPPPLPHLNACPPALKKIKLSDGEDGVEGVTRDACVGTSVGTLTEPECLGPCEPGSSVTLEGIVWHETEGGVLVVNVTWRGKTYVGTLLDCTRHDWAPPRFCDSPTSDLESRTPKGRAKRGRASASTTGHTVPPSSSSSLPAATTSSGVASTTQSATSSAELTIAETRSGKLRQTSVKGRGRVTPASPVKDISTTTKRKGRDADSSTSLTSLPEGKASKKARLGSRGTSTNGSVSPSAEQQESTNGGETSLPPVSPQLIECPEPNCNKKYKHINGLKYHQSHAHTNNSAETGGDVSVEGNGESRSGVESSEAAEEKQGTPPKHLVSTPVEKSGHDIVKPSVLRPAVVVPNSSKNDASRLVSAPHSHAPDSTSTSTNKQPTVEDGNFVNNKNQGSSQPDHSTKGIASHESSLANQNVANQTNKMFTHAPSQPGNADENNSQPGSNDGVNQTQVNQSGGSPQLQTTLSEYKSQNPQKITTLQPNHHIQIGQKAPVVSCQGSHSSSPYALKQPSQQLQPQTHPPPPIPPATTTTTAIAAHHLPPHLQHNPSLSSKQFVVTQAAGHPQQHQQLKGNVVITGQPSSKLRVSSSGQPPNIHAPASNSHSNTQNLSPQSAVDQSRTEVKQQEESVNKITNALPSPVAALNRPVISLAGGQDNATATALSTSTMSVTAVPQGTPLSSLPGSTSLKMKPNGEAEYALLGKTRDLVNGIQAKTELDLSSSREDARSPAYSDISDANESTPNIDGDSDQQQKDYKEEKKGDLGIGGVSPYPYGLYYGAYGQPPHPYLIPPLQHAQLLNSKPVDPKDIKDKSLLEKDKRENLIMPVPGNEYVKIPPQYLYSYSHLYPGGYPDLYMRDAMCKGNVGSGGGGSERSKSDQEDCSVEDRGPTDLSRSTGGLANSSDRESSSSSSNNKQDQKEQVGAGLPPDRRMMDLPLPYRYAGPYDPRMPLIAMDKNLDSKSSVPRALSPMLSPSVNSTSSNGMSREEKDHDKRLAESKLEGGVKPTMETTGPPPPPNSSAYYPPFPYSHVPFDPYRPPLIPGMGPITGGLPPYMTGPPPGLPGLRYPPIGIPNCPEDLSSGGPPPFPPGLYSSGPPHKMTELQERAIQKSPSGFVTSVGSPLPPVVGGGNPAFSVAPHCLSPSVSSPSAGIQCSVSNHHQGALMSTSHFGERKTPPIGMRFPPHPSLPEGYSYPFIPSQFPSHFGALGMNPSGIPAVGMTGPGTPPGGLAPQPK